MSGIFDGVYGAAFPDVVMNSGPLPPSSGPLPAPLHDTPDGRINYNSTLLGEITPYAYGEPAYLSSQHSYLNIPHRIQKLIPVVYLPEPEGDSVFRLSHGIDDGDVVFSMRMNKTSLFCTGSTSSTRRTGLGTNIEPLINLPTLNYILAGMQLKGMYEPTSLWSDFLHALDPVRFPERKDVNKRDYNTYPLDIQDLVHVLEHCIRPFGIMRGSEKQGGQNEATLSPATWPVPFIGTFVLDGKEDHIVNMWHHLDVDAGEDLVLRLKPMPLRKYTLNHYYKQPMFKTFHNALASEGMNAVVWQLVPDKMSYDIDEQWIEHVPANFPDHADVAWMFYTHKDGKYKQKVFINYLTWQELGYWHIGRTQVRMNKYIVHGGQYYHDDMANALRSQYMLMTVQPVFCRLPFRFELNLHADDNLVMTRDNMQITNHAIASDLRQRAPGDFRLHRMLHMDHDGDGNGAGGEEAMMGDDNSEWQVVTLSGGESAPPATSSTTTTSSSTTTTTTTTATTTTTSSTTANSADAAGGVLKRGGPLKRVAAGAAPPAAVGAAARRGAPAGASLQVVQGMTIREDGSTEMQAVQTL